MTTPHKWWGILRQGDQAGHGRPNLQQARLLMVDDVTLQQQLSAWRAVSEARSAILMAKRDLEPVDKMIGRLAATSDPHEMCRIAWSLFERGGDHGHEVIFADTLRRISAEAERRPYRERESLDRSVGGLMRVLSKEVALPLAMEWGLHHTKRRREWAIKVIRTVPPSPKVATYLLERYDATGDLRFAKLILSGPLPDSVDRTRLFQVFEAEDDGYWQARVAEAALKAQPTVARQLCIERPHAFFWAVGRLGLVEHAPLIVETLSRANDKLPLVGIGVWALGRLSATAEILSLEPLIDQLERDYPDPFGSSAE